eukprot:m.60700 g.60700  ORF g.60700 m.60700 type:complete len:211 (+) comp16114_c0_seq2:2094-2726(+)
MRHDVTNSVLAEQHQLQHLSSSSSSSSSLSSSSSSTSASSSLSLTGPGAGAEHSVLAARAYQIVRELGLPEQDQEIWHLTPTQLHEKKLLLEAELQRLSSQEPTAETSDALAMVSKRHLLVKALFALVSSKAAASAAPDTRSFQLGQYQMLVSEKLALQRELMAFESSFRAEPARFLTQPIEERDRIEQLYRRYQDIKDMLARMKTGFHL